MVSRVGYHHISWFGDLRKKQEALCEMLNSVLCTGCAHSQPVTLFVAVQKAALGYLSLLLCVVSL